MFSFLLDVVGKEHKKRAGTEDCEAKKRVRSRGLSHPAHSPTRAIRWGSSQRAPVALTAA